MTEIRPFGSVGGIPVDEVVLRSDEGLAARVVTWGALLRELVVPGPDGPRSVVLGLARVEDYVSHAPTLGVFVGRYANRIGGARFRLDGREHVLVPNENGNQLHGGPRGFSRRAWSLIGADETRVHLGLVSEAGDMGWPGRLVAHCSYEVLPGRTLRITLEAQCDEPCPVNLSTHGYYNLDGTADARDHRLLVRADLVTPTDPDGIPTGEMRPVPGTPYDFRAARPARLEPGGGILDINFVLRREPTSAPAFFHAADLSSDRNGTSLELWTTEPGLQVYDGARLDVPVPGLGGRAVRPHAGIALEPQRFPDGPNHVHFPRSVVLPGEVSRQVTEIRFPA